jgi:hypothetical protein
MSNVKRRGTVYMFVRGLPRFAGSALGNFQAAFRVKAGNFFVKKNGPRKCVGADDKNI